MFKVSSKWEEWAKKINTIAVNIIMTYWEIKADVTKHREYDSSFLGLT